MDGVTFRVGIDIGGTFTDSVVITSQGEMRIFKSPSTPDDSSVGLFNCLKKAADAFGLEWRTFMERIEILVHGTTVATNTMLQYNGAKTGLIATKGFRDTLEMRRAHKENIWDLSLASPPPIIPRHLRLGVTERLDSAGQVITPLDEEETRSAARTLKAEGVQAIAVCTLFSFKNPVHERRIREIILEEYPGCYVSISSEILPQVREYERTSTTAVNAYVGPVLGRYLRKLQDRLAEAGLRREVLITQSNGGIMSARYGADHGSATLLSGPSAGAVGGMFFAVQLGMPNLIVMDMGGTSYDVSLIKDGAYALTTDGEIARYRVALPMIDIHTIGAGGGSIAYLDKGKMLKVGPQSAGAIPGPVCTGKGGLHPTTTDVNVVLGYINPDFYLGGEFQLFPQSAFDAIARDIAQPLGIDPVEAAYGIYRLVNTNMADATKVVSVERGHDPRDFALVAAGGAGALHGSNIARIVGIPRVIVPKTASVFCALGMLESDLKHDYVRTLWAPLANLDLEELNRVFAGMEAEARATLAKEGIPPEQIQIDRGLDLRYIGQHHEVPVIIPGGTITAESLPEIARLFHTAHHRLFLYSEPDSPLESINLRMTATGKIAKTSLADWPAGGPSAAAAARQTRKAYFGDAGGWLDTSIYDGRRLKSGNQIEGPAIIEEVTTTIVIPPNDSAWIDRLGNVVIEINGKKANRNSANLHPEPLSRLDGGESANHLMDVQAVDPITMSVVFHRLGTINREMGITMMRTSRSPIFAEVHDFSCAICDWSPRIVAQVDGVPSHTASSMLAARAVVDKFRGKMKPGDVFVINDPYQGGTHLADVTVVKPIYYRGELLFMAINRAHHLDVGGMVAGSYSPQATEIYHEGIRIPAIRIYEEDEPIQPILDLLKLNTRMPDLFESDIRAQVASCSVAQRRLLEMAEELGADRLKEILEAIYQYAEQMMRREIARIPEGTYTGQAVLDGDGFDRHQIKIQVTVKVQGEEMWVDFAGTDPQTTGFINSPFANSCTSVYVAVLTCVSQDVPHNEGAYQPIHINAAQGSIVNPLPPAPVASCTLDTACAILEAMYMALSKALPDKAPAAWNRWCGPAISGTDPRTGQFYVGYAFCGMGGGGAMPTQDGQSYIGDGIDLGGLTAPNIETNELDMPHITECHELSMDSGGAGKFRGGLGVHYAIRFYDEAPFLAIFGDGVENPPFGLFDGHPGTTNRLMVNEGSPREAGLPAKGTRALKKGDRYTIYSSGGGGWGNPLERDPAAVLDDVRNGYVSLEAAEKVYGVAIRSGTIDPVLTEKLRAGQAGR